MWRSRGRTKDRFHCFGIYGQISGRTGGRTADGRTDRQKLEDLSSRAHDDRLIPDLHGGTAHNAVHAAVEERLSGFGAARSR